MKLYMIFSDCDVFEGPTHKIPEADIKGVVQPNSVEPLPVDSLATLMSAPSALEDGSAALITIPAIPMEESVTPATTPTVSADEPANPTPFQRQLVM